MWQGKLRENVCDWRLRRRDWNSSGMNAAVQVFCQRMCKIWLWCGKKMSNTKKSMEWRCQSFNPHLYSENIGIQTVVVVWKASWMSVPRYNNTFFRTLMFVKLVILKRQQLITSVSFLGTYHSEHSLEARLTWHGIIMLPTLGSHFTNLIMLIMSWSSWVSDSTIKAPSSSLTAEFSRRTRTLYVHLCNLSPAWSTSWSAECITCSYMFF